MSHGTPEQGRADRDIPPGGKKSAHRQVPFEAQDTNMEEEDQVRLQEEARGQQAEDQGTVREEVGRGWGGLPVIGGCTVRRCLRKGR